MRLFKRKRKTSGPSPEPLSERVEAEEQDSVATTLAPVDEEPVHGEAILPRAREGAAAPPQAPTTEEISAPEDDPTSNAAPSLNDQEKKRSLFGRLRGALARTGSGLVEGISGIFAGGKVVDADLLDELETLLLSADVGIDATDRILNGIAPKLKRKELANAQAVVAALKEGMLALLAPIEKRLELPSPADTPFVILVVGVNGAGKTTTIGKLAQRLTQSGRSVLLAAGDTFRAAAIEQLQVWGERHDVPVIAQAQGADSASVAFDALDSATARGTDVLMVDTAGRLHTQAGLMEELAKVRRVLSKRAARAPHEVLLVLDASTGQNALVQATQFGEAVDVTGIVLTKLDGTAKGGMIFSSSERLGIPIRFIGVGESADDLREFVAKDFVDALFDTRPDV